MEDSGKNMKELTEKQLRFMANQVVLEERSNLKTKKYTDTKMVQIIGKIIVAMEKKRF